VRASFANTHIDRRQISFVLYYISYTAIKTKIYVHITSPDTPYTLSREKSVPFKKDHRKSENNQDTLARDASA